MNGQINEYTNILSLFFTDPATQNHLYFILSIGTYPKVQMAPSDVCVREEISSELTRTQMLQNRDTEGQAFRKLGGGERVRKAWRAKRLQSQWKRTGQLSLPTRRGCLCGSEEAERLQRHEVRPACPSPASSSVLSPGDRSPTQKLALGLGLCLLSTPLPAQPRSLGSGGTHL